MKRILVIGSEGNIGKVLCPYLRTCGHEVYRCDIKSGYAPDYFVADINCAVDLLNVFNTVKPDVVYLLAAMVSRVTCEQAPSLAVNTNLGGLNNIIQLCRTYQVKLIYFSTSEVYGNIEGILSEDRECHPNNLYGLTKYLGEQLVRYYEKDLSYVIVRPFMFYDELETVGDHRSAMIRFASHLYNREKIEVHIGSSRSWMHMTDGITVLEKLMNVDKETVNVGSQQVILTSQLAKKICDILHLSYEDYVIETPLPEKMTMSKFPDTRKQFALTGFEPLIDLDYGIHRVINKISKR